MSVIFAHRVINMFKIFEIPTSHKIIFLLSKCDLQ